MAQRMAAFVITFLWAAVLSCAVQPSRDGGGPHSTLAVDLAASSECTETLRVEEVWSAGEGTLPAGVLLPVRAVWSPTPGAIRLFRPDGELEGDIQLPPPGGGGFFSSLSDDGSTAILRAGVVVRDGGPLSTRVLDLEGNQVLYEGEKSSGDYFSLSPGGEMVLCRHVGRSSSLLRANLSPIRSTNSVVVKWDFSGQHLATLEVDLGGDDDTRSDLRSPPIKGPLYLRVYDFEGNTILEEFLDNASAGIDIDIEDDGTVAALYRKFDVARWRPPGIYHNSDFVLVVGDTHRGSTERRGFTVPLDTHDVHLALSPDADLLALSVLGLGNISLYDLDAVRERPEALDQPLRKSSLPVALPGKPSVQIKDSGRVLEVGCRGCIVSLVGCLDGDRRYERILILDMDGSCALVPTPDLKPGWLSDCRFFGPHDHLLVNSGSHVFKVFRILSR